MYTSHDLLEAAMRLTYEFFESAPLVHKDPGCDEAACAAVLDLLLIQLEPVACVGFADVSQAVDDALSLFRASSIPRQHDGSPILRTPDPMAIGARLATINAIPQPEQRTAAWYAFRGSYLTASSAWKAFATPGAFNQLVNDKCTAANMRIEDAPSVPSGKGVNVDSPLHWGQKYEPLSVMWYEHRYGTKIGEFGCIPHPSIECLAASPDGINIDPKNPRYGRMLEIKNVVSRTITGIPKMDYWIQMQLQMAVCGLDECDFLEMKFREYEDAAEWQADGTAWTAQDGSMKGKIIQFMSDGVPEYEYQPLGGLSPEEARDWEQEAHERHEGDTWIRDTYWKLEVVSCVLVEFNPEWMAAAEVRLRDVWATIEYEAANGYAHRAPAKRKAQTRPDTCLLDRPASCLLVSNGLGGFSPLKGGMPPIAAGEEDGVEMNVVTSPLADTNSSRSSSPGGLRPMQVA